MTDTQPAPIACTLPSGEFSERMVWIADVNRMHLLRHHQQDLRLELMYAPKAAAQVRELVRREQQCCAFLAFTVWEGVEAVHLLIEAPESARAAATELYDQFHAKEPTGAGCACSTATTPATPTNQLAHLAAASSGTATLACRVRGVLPSAGSE